MKYQRKLDIVQFLGDIAAFQFPETSIATSILTSSLGEYFRKSIKKANDIAIEEISYGRFETIKKNDPDGFVAIAYRYHQAAIQGTAANNLRLLARLIEGTPDLPPITASEFLYYASVISSLSPEELIVFGTLIRIEDSQETNPRTNNEGRSWANRNAVIDELVPDFISTKDDVAGVFAALSRTGFVVESAGWGGGEWRTTSMGREVEALAGFSAQAMATHQR